MIDCAGLGAFMYGLVFVWLWLTSEFGYMGQESRELKALVDERYLFDYLLFNLKILGYTIVLGGLVGLLAGLVATGLSRGSSGVYIKEIVGLTAVSLFVLARSVLLTPQLFWGTYAETGVARTLIDVLLDQVNPGWIDLCLCLIALLAVVGVKKLAGFRAAATLLILTLLAVWWVRAPVVLPEGTSRAPNVVLLIIDSLRSDRVSAHGYPRQTTPEIDRLIARGDSFVNSYVSLPRTTPAIVSLLTGQRPPQHGVRTMFPSAEERQKRRVALPRLFKEKGYSTAVVSDYAGEMFRDLDLGFDRVVTPSFNFPAVYRQRSLEIQFLLLAWLNNPLGRGLLPDLALLPQNADPEVLTDQALRVTSSLPEPFFLTVFYSATHFPYTATYPDYRTFVDRDYRGPYRFAVPYLQANGQTPSPEDQAQVGALYDGALHGVDRALGRLLQRLDEGGRLANSVVVLTGDHGENLYDYGSGIGHGDHFVGGLQSLRVPLVVVRPEEHMPNRYEQDVRDIDLLPTLVELFDLPRKKIDDLPGRSLYQTMADARVVYAETGLWMSPVSTRPIAGKQIAYPDILTVGEIDFASGDEVVVKPKYRDLVRTAKHRLLKDGPWVLIYMPTRSGVEYGLYREDQDPSFAKNLALQHSQKLQEMREQLLAIMAKEPGVKIRNDFVVYENH